MRTAAIVMSALGGVSELMGLGIVVVGIVQDRARARQLLARPTRRRRPERQYPAHVSTPGRPFGSGLTTTAHELREFRGEVERAMAGIANIIIDLRKAVDQERDDAMDMLREEMAEADSELRDNLRAILEGTGREILGVALLGLGIVLAVAGSIVGTLA